MQLESFSLDHTKIKAPYVRLSKRVEVPGSGYEISTFDFRVRTPNTELLTPKVAHSLEHLFAVALRAEFEEHQSDLKVLDVSPMGCRTGYYLTVLNPGGSLSLSRATEAVKAMLKGALEIKELPGARLETCGAYREHDFDGARVEIRRLSGEKLVPLEKPPLLP
ncbi:MAG: S-ribosylhomocysteine lyase [Candidatus Bathyarchaeota archaeon]|nr:S-ribosylhomocysteine lyase [Candidatus Bathyarchaeota archaeon]